MNKFGRSPVLEALVKEHLKTYFKLIRVPIREGLLCEDKVRSTSAKFQEDIDRQFDRFIEILDLGSVVQRIKKEKLSDGEIVERVLNAL